MSSHIDSTYLCQLTAAQIQEILVLNGVLIQQYQPQFHRWLTIAQLPNLGQLTLSLEPEKAAEIDRRLHDREIVEFTATTTVMNINICDRYVFIPLLKQPNLSNRNRSQLWGRICLVGNLNSIWTSQDLSWVQALGQQLLTAMNLFAGFTNNDTNQRDSSTSELVELIERIAELESVCHQKDDFINNISHDLRAPLMNIKMAMRLLKTSLNEDRQIADLLSGHRAEKYLAILEQECDREVELINNILELQRLELANEKIAIEAVEIQAWLQNAIAPFIHRTSIDRQQLVTTVSEWIPTIATDRFYLTKIFTELLNNACKYTQVDGQIHVEISGEPNSEWLTIVVKNQTQISAQHLPHIFEQFYRIPSSDRFSAGDGTLSSQQGGSGLGLSLVQKLVQQLNGQIHVASISGWTEFAVKLPLNHPV
mgnify:FL=1